MYAFPQAITRQGLQIYDLSCQQWQILHLQHDATGHPATILRIYQHVLQVSVQEDADPLQLIFHYDVILSLHG